MILIWNDYSYSWIKCAMFLIGSFSDGTSGKEPACQGRRHKRCGFSPWVRKIPWRRSWQPTLVFLPGKSHGQRSLEDLILLIADIFLFLFFNFSFFPNFSLILYMTPIYLLPQQLYFEKQNQWLFQSLQYTVITITKWWLRISSCVVPSTKNIKFVERCLDKGKQL